MLEIHPKLNYVEDDHCKAISKRATLDPDWASMSDLFKFLCALLVTVWLSSSTIVFNLFFFVYLMYWATLSTKNKSQNSGSKVSSGLRKQPTFKEIAAHQDRQKLRKCSSTQHSVDFPVWSSAHRIFCPAARKKRTNRSIIEEMRELQNQQRIPLRGMRWKVARPRPNNFFKITRARSSWPRRKPLMSLRSLRSKTLLSFVTS